MKVRVGYGLGTRSTTNDQERFGGFVDDLERLGFDSLWLSERIGGDAPDPVVGMAFAAGRTKRLKFGMSVMVLPGRNPMLVAKGRMHKGSHRRATVLGGRGGRVGRPQRRPPAVRASADRTITDYLANARLGTAA